MPAPRSIPRRVRWAAVALAAAALAAVALVAVPGCASYVAVPRESGSAVSLVRLGDANAALVVGEGPGARAVLVDTGFEGARERRTIEGALATEGLGWPDVALVVLTHGHGDHAGNAAWIAATHGVPVLAGEPDRSMLSDGENGPLDPIGPEAHLVRLLVDGDFPPVAVDVPLAAEPGRSSRSLRPYGIDGDVALVGGHTGGSVAAVLATGEAVVGDLVRGGYLGGRFARGRPLTHYFHDDRNAARAAVGALVRAGVGRFYVGHGGPLSAGDVAVWAGVDPNDAGTAPVP